MRGVAVVVAIIVVVGFAGLVVVGDTSPDGPEVDQEDISPGQSVSTAVAAGDAEVQGDLEVRAFGHKLQAAETPEERAALIAERFDEDEETLEVLEERAEELEAEYEAGNISRGQYISELTRIAAKSNAVGQTMAQSANASVGIEDELRGQGVSVDEIQSARERAHEQAPGLVDGVPGLDTDREPGPPLNVSVDDIGPPIEPGNESGPPDDRPGN